MPKFLVFDGELMATALGWRLKLENNDVRVLSLKPDGKEHLLNMVKHVSNLNEGLAWVGKDGYVICGDEEDVTPIRKRGFKVYGGNAVTKKMEEDRVYQDKIARSCGVDVPNSNHVKNVDEAIKFIQRKPDQYVLKQMGHAPKAWNFVGKKRDGSDIIDQLEWMKTQPEFKKFGGKVPFMLQEMAEGIEFATSGWWMGNDWKMADDGLPLIEVNVEHKKSGTGNTGITCGEAGTVLKFSDNRKLFDATLGKLTPFLKQNCKDVRINVDANCAIIEEEDGNPALFEFTPREGYPAQGLILHMLDQDAGKFFADLIDGKDGVKTKDTWGVVTVLGCGTYPHETEPGRHYGSYKGQPVEIPQWEKTIDPDIHPHNIMYDTKKDFFRVSDHYEDLLSITKDGEDILKVNEACVKEMKLINVRAPSYRLDIGQKFVEEEKPKLESLGYL